MRNLAPTGGVRARFADRFEKNDLHETNGALDRSWREEDAFANRSAPSGANASKNASTTKCTFFCVGPRTCAPTRGPGWARKPDPIWSRFAHADHRRVGWPTWASTLSSLLRLLDSNTRSGSAQVASSEKDAVSGSASAPVATAPDQLAHSLAQALHLIAEVREEIRSLRREVRAREPSAERQRSGRVHEGLLDFSLDVVASRFKV